MAIIERKAKVKVEKELSEAKRRSEAPFFEYNATCAGESDMRNRLRIFRVELLNTGEYCRKYKLISRTPNIKFILEEPLRVDWICDYDKRSRIVIGFSVPFVDTSYNSISGNYDLPQINNIVLDFDIQFECPRTGFIYCHSYSLRGESIIRTDPA